MNHIKGDTIYEAELHYGLDSSKELISYQLKVNNLLMHHCLQFLSLQILTNEEKKQLLLMKKQDVIERKR